MIPHIRTARQHGSEIGHKVDPTTAAIYMLPGAFGIFAGAICLVEVNFSRFTCISEGDRNRHGTKGKFNQLVGLNPLELAVMGEVVDIGPVITIACLDLFVRPAGHPICLGVDGLVNEERFEAFGCCEPIEDIG